MGWGDAWGWVNDNVVEPLNPMSYDSIYDDLGGWIQSGWNQSGLGDSSTVQGGLLDQIANLNLIGGTTSFNDVVTGIPQIAGDTIQGVTSGVLWPMENIKENFQDMFNPSGPTQEELIAGYIDQYGMPELGGGGIGSPYANLSQAGPENYGPTPPRDQNINDVFAGVDYVDQVLGEAGPYGGGSGGGGSPTPTYQGPSALDYYTQLANLQREDAIRAASAGTGLVESEYARLLEDYDRWEAERGATTEASNVASQGRLDEALEFMGVSLDETSSALADIGIDALETVREVGGEVGAALYGIYNMGADLTSNLDRIANDTLAQMRSQTDSDLAMGLFQISENLQTTLSMIDASVLQRKISGAEAAAAAQAELQQAQQDAQMQMDIATIIAAGSANRGGALSDPWEVYALMEAGLIDDSMLMAPDPPDPVEQPNMYQGVPMEWLDDYLGLFDTQYLTQEELDEIVSGIIAQRGGAGFDPATIAGLPQFQS